MVSPAAVSEPVWIESWTRGEGESRARSLMEHTWGVEPHGVWSAPGRVPIIGEHTDFNGGLVLPTVTPHRTYVAARLRDDARVRIVSERASRFEGPGAMWEGRLDGITPDSARGWPAYAVGVLWALRERGFDGMGLDLAVTSCVPANAGLSSSGALESAVAQAVNALWRLALDSDESQAELAEACLHGEETIAQAPTGGMDQHTILRCREGDAVELDFSERPPILRHRPLYFPDYGLGLLVIDARTAGRNRTPGVTQRMAECQAAAAALGVTSLGQITDYNDGRRRIRQLKDPLLRRRARHVLTENERVRSVAAELADPGPAHERFVEIGKQLFRSHASLEVDFEVSSPEQNLAVDVAFHFGALGARMVGAGFGGASIALVRRVEAQATARRIDRAFVEAGRERPHFLMI